jgi:3-oxoacyl-[acyl-carrier-protein] synthase-3
MAYLEFNSVRIAALTCAVPSHVQKIDVSTSSNPNYVRNFQKQTGIMQRHISITEQTCTDLAYGAAIKALDKAGWDAKSIDALVFMSQTPDFNVGTGNSFIMHYRLALPTDTLAFDITLGCSSFPYGLSICSSLLQQPHIQRVMMLSGDTQWYYLNDKTSLLAEECFLHGEGSTAILMEKHNNNNNNIVVSLYSDGSGYKYLFNPVAGARNAWANTYEKILLPNGAEFITSSKANYMDGLEITSFSTTQVVDSIRAFINIQHKTLDDYDGLILHQANMQIIKTIAKRLKLSMDKVPVSLDRYANTSGASTSLTIADAYAGQRAEKLSLLTCAFGIGLSWGIAALDIDPDVIEPIFLYDDRFDNGFVRPVTGE